MNISEFPETVMHRVRWVLAIAWLVLVASFFYDPVTTFLLDPNSRWSFFRLDPIKYLDPERCPTIQGECVVQDIHHMTPMIWWTMIVPAGILILMTLGHEFWRRICPLSFFSQIPRALGLQRKRQVVDPLSGVVGRELVVVGQNSWLGRNHLYVQFGLFLLGLCARLLAVNADRTALGLFLIFTILCSILVGYLYAGKSWCQYFCPMAPVQMVYTGQRSLFGSKAHIVPKPAITQSMCRTVDLGTGEEVSTCVACKAHCIDIDSEDSYWAELFKPGRRLIQYGYLGAVIAFYYYYKFYSGDWDYYFSGVWTREQGQLSRLFDPGFFFNGVAIPIPKLLAVPLTFAVFVSTTYLLGIIFEKSWRKIGVRQNGPLSAETNRSQSYTIFTVVSFWVFFCFGSRPWLNRIHPVPFYAVNGLLVAIGIFWFVQNYGRTRPQYELEQMTVSLRKQLSKQLPSEQLEDLLHGRRLGELHAKELYSLTKAINAGSGNKAALETYTGVLEDQLEQQIVDPTNSLKALSKLREGLGLKESDHFKAIEQIATRKPNLLVAPTSPQAVSLLHSQKLPTQASRKVSSQTQLFSSRKPRR